MSGSRPPQAGGDAPAPPREDRPEPAAASPRFLDRYEIHGLLGEGGMGRVYRAHDPLLERFVAVKVLGGGSAERVSRFLNEARAQARVSHPNVARVFEVGTSGEQPFIAMELVEGRPLDEAARGLPPARVAALLRAVAEGVDAANRLGLVHRDLKPSNVLVEERPDGTLHPVVVDFGLARDLDARGITLSGSAVGTPAFMAPEQATGDAAAVGPRTDVWGLGATLFAVLAGRPPFEGATPFETMTRVVRDELPPLHRAVPRVPEDLATIVGKCLEKEPARRYATAAELARDLARFEAGEPVAARPPSTVYRLAMRVRKHRVVVAVAGAGLAALVVLGAYTLYQRARLVERAEVAREFGAMVERVESDLRQSYLLPAHDVRPARRRAEERIAELKARTRELGSVARAAGAYAVGRALLALGRPGDAITPLEEAWNQGDRRPETAWALALAHARRYQAEVAALTTVKNPLQREARRRDADAHDRGPAARWLRQARRADPAGRAYAEALLAALERRWEPAVARARDAFGRAEGFYEAKLLEAQIESLRAADESHLGALDGARASLERAAVAAAEALRIGQSDPAAWEAACAARTARMHVDLYSGGAGLEEARAAADAACAAVLRVDPDSARATAALGRIHRIGAEARVRHGQDPEPLLGQALSEARRAVQLDPGDAANLAALGTVLQVKARAVIAAGGDPRPVFDEGTGALARAAALRPGDETVRNVLGVTWWYRAQWETTHGADPRHALDEAARALERSAALLPAYAYAWLNLAGVWNDRAAWEISRGGDPAEALRAAADACARGVEKAPAMADAWNNGGVTWLYEADAARRRDADPREPVGRARAAFARALEINPALGAARINAAQARRYEAAWLVRHGLEASAALAEARTLIAPFAEKDPFGGLALVELAEVHLVEAEREERAGRSPLPALDAAARRLGQALALDPKLADALRASGREALARARFERASGRPPAAALAAARDALARAAALDAGHVDVVALRAALAAF